ncbi:hypothetical protein AN1437.2 [Aspergillus nidulans FGSC A4]|uniref:C2H2 finger domain protein, putative (AFU_orthologue AFUA_8G04300) n=1 Tax=Emericella nidulans (strain FGSC A4 / ATCC 38163 / CBS 112.46 / NRRL 194 / M139) TaxID=227321 RepID=Q5BDE3_EMENI|nr:hypothetical protein [Aspergillus nidulans FGSC A4]EAA64567.1 hypothetical protein AN1437.2 [Aspergillus nidulans FGSC A4]CBF84857.1 TPA: C2H2 finger domain protein, putative (AFU_orthologue; AFUA_8G04300) [Aspergillus nidulans FGSC A4]|eukprot:XP_659041.1 hypothetical protein AN1437.2 [Aspergillus nidulans FGSC A4]
MSAVSPQFVQSDSNDRNLDPELSNPFLTENDPEEAEFQKFTIRLTPVDDRGSAWTGSTSSQDHSINNTSTTGNHEGYGTTYSEFLSPVDEWASDISGHTSPADLMIPGVWPVIATSPQNVTASSPTQSGPSPSSPPASINPSQLLTPVLTNHPSPASDTRSVGSPRIPRAQQPPVPRLKTTLLDDNLGPGPVSESVTTISPIVKVESYSRGDSPVRDSFSTNRRPSQSSIHLSPGGASNASGEDATIEDDRHSVSRSADGAWVPNVLTGQAGLAPDAREDVYVPSPNELDSQRKLAERNADIYTWSEAVSEAHSEAGDDYLCFQRGRTDYHGTRRRAKSTGDPSLDYFSLKFTPDRSEIRGPGLVLHETSDYSDDETESSAPVSVKEERLVQEAFEMTPPEPQSAETGEPQAHQFLGSPPWRDIELDRSPQTTRMQPVSSTQAMVEYQRRARETDAISRVATWGTRDLDANSIRSFQMMSLNENGKEKKHERRNSFLKYLPQKKGNLLKRQRQKTDLSTMQPVHEGEAQDTESKAAPQRKDSFPHRLSLPFTPKTTNYSISGAVMATTRQMAAIGGKDSLSVVSPSTTTTTTTKPWNTLKVRGRSRSEVPRAPGLFELMTTHGGPPVPNISYTSEPVENKEAKHARPQHDAAEEDDDDDSEEKLIMEFPIPKELPIPTLEGFKTQILRLNPRIEPALIDRFAHEQVRRYKRLIEIKQTHARDVNHRKCKAGKFCFALGGTAKLLPPRLSAQDGDSHTQFQIPRPGEEEESSEDLGETTMLAHFPQGVPHPPPQVKLLPAEFECMVCYHVKKFQKPSDWTKHIYEDVQPFTCTFPDCTDPKSFKRKADWVRHESERHRQLEWWECSLADCRHKCYRKDNFVQHLVREHKMPEPKVKKPRNRELSDGASNDPTSLEVQEEINREREINGLWKLVESCHFETARNPREEPCRFCGNVCTNWKKLTVHLAKHMEQLAIPILGLVKERDFPYTVNIGSSGNPDNFSGQVPIAQKDSDFDPRLDTGVTEGPGTADNFTQAPYSNSHPGSSEPIMLPFNTGASYLPNASMPLDSTAPNPAARFEGVTPYTAHGGGVAGLAGDQTRLMAMHQHQNSVTYPPFNARPRLTVPNQDMRVLPEYNSFSMSPTEMQYDPQTTAYVSSGAENHYPYQGPIASAMPYDSGYQGQ